MLDRLSIFMIFNGLSNARRASRALLIYWYQIKSRVENEELQDNLEIPKSL